MITLRQRDQAFMLAVVAVLMLMVTIAAIAVLSHRKFTPMERCRNDGLKNCHVVSNPDGSTSVYGAV